MKILMTGATGFVGKKLAERLLSEGHELHILTRNPHALDSVLQDPRVKAFEWSDFSSLPPADSVTGINGVINLMGENIAAKRWSDQQKKLLQSSRIDSTTSLVDLINKNLSTPLDFFISASAIGIYPVDTDVIIDESTKPAYGFLANLCKEWEARALALKNCKRTVIIRTSVVLESFGGALQKMLPPFKLGLGGPIGDGRQVMSWIHLDDLVDLYAKAVSDERYQGIYNASTSHPVDNFHFTKELGNALRRPTLFPVPKTALKLAFGEMSSVILGSQHVVSKRLSEAGFQFRYPTIEEAFHAIFNKRN